MNNRNENIKNIMMIGLFYVGSVIIYLLILGIYARLVTRPMFFPISCLLALIIPMLLYFVCKRFWLSLLDGMARGLMIFSCILIIVLFSVFGPTFIDRSISYHLAFIAVEQGEVNKNELESSGYVQMVFDKRYEDALASGFISPTEENGTYIPTRKAKIMYEIMKPLGMVTGSLEEYKYLLKIMNKDKT